MTPAISLTPITNVSFPIVGKDGTMTREFLTWLTEIFNSFLLIPQSTAAGNVIYPLPSVKSMPNREIILIKTSSDGNTLSASANGTDTINKQGAWGAASLTIGTAQGAFARLQGDGSSNWYVV